MKRYLNIWVSDTLFKIAMGFWIYFILLAMAASPVQAGHYFRYDEDVQGKVIDADTRQPLPDVVVMAMWVTEHTRISIEPEERYYDYFETLTDENGEFSIPGKGRNIFRNMPRPKLCIYKAGYPIRDIRFSTDGYPPGLEVSFKDGKRIIFYQKLSPEKRKEYVTHYELIPYSEMAGAAVIPEKYRLYSDELARDYEALGMRFLQTGDPDLIIKRGVVYPATNQEVSPRNSQ